MKSRWQWKKIVVFRRFSYVSLESFLAITGMAWQQNVFCTWFIANATKWWMTFSPCERNDSPLWVTKIKIIFNYSTARGKFGFGMRIQHDNHLLFFFFFHRNVRAYQIGNGEFSGLFTSWMCYLMPIEGRPRYRSIDIRYCVRQCVGVNRKEYNNL